MLRSIHVPACFAAVCFPLWSELSGVSLMVTDGFDPSQLQTHRGTATRDENTRTQTTTCVFGDQFIHCSSVSSAVMAKADRETMFASRMQSFQSQLRKCVKDVSRIDTKQNTVELVGARLKLLVRSVALWSMLWKRPLTLVENIRLKTLREKQLIIKLARNSQELPH